MQMVKPMTPLETLKEQTNQFPRKIHKVAENVYTATGYSAANAAMIIGDDGLIIIDTTESTGAAKLILAEFRKITDLPVKTIVYTHGHRDHISGAEVFAENNKPQIIARSNFTNDLGPATKKVSPGAALMARTKRQFGIGLSFPDERINIGVGPGDRIVEGMGAGFVPATETYSTERHTINSCGITLELCAAPGETPDQMVVWYAAEKMLFCADNFYHSFPNLYAIRGTAYRDFNSWADTVDLMLTFDAEKMLTGHTLPVIGAAEIKERLTDYRDAIGSVISQTVEHMNAGRTPDEIAHLVRLPDTLINKPWLQEFYGRVAYAARAYFAGTLGWFDGNPTTLQPLAPKDRSQRFAKLAGGAEALWKNLDAAVAGDDLQWALELADHLITLENRPADAKRIKADVLTTLADREVNAPTRNYYLLYANELKEQLSA